MINKFKNENDKNTNDSVFKKFFKFYETNIDNKNEAFFFQEIKI